MIECSTTLTVTLPARLLRPMKKSKWKLLADVPLQGGRVTLELVSAPELAAQEIDIDTFLVFVRSMRDVAGQQHAEVLLNTYKWRIPEEWKRYWVLCPGTLRKGEDTIGAPFFFWHRVEKRWRIRLLWLPFKSSYTAHSKRIMVVRQSSS